MLEERVQASESRGIRVQEVPLKRPVERQAHDRGRPEHSIVSGDGSPSGVLKNVSGHEEAHAGMVAAGSVSQPGDVLEYSMVNADGFPS